MTLATRCPSCVTVFKVVQDQLRVSDGWVRCGRCNEVFNAVDHLVELGASPGAGMAAAGMGRPHGDAPTTRPDAGPSPTMAAPTPAPAPEPTGFEPTASPPVEPDWAAAGLGSSGQGPEHAVDAYADRYAEPTFDPEVGALSGDEADVAPARAPWPTPAGAGRIDETRGDIVLDDDERRAPAATGPEPFEEAHLAALPNESGPDAGQPAQGEPAGRPGPGRLALDALEERAASAAPASDSALPVIAEPEPPAPVPTFLREAERAARWQRPPVRRALMATSGLLAVLLLVQVGVEYRNVLSARWPGLKPALEAACRLAGCRIEAPRWIEAVAVDSSGLVRVEGTQTYRFSVVLANRAHVPLALPSIDLTLTDARGQVVARRALQPLDLGHEGDRLEAGRELPLQATLAVADRVVAGYTIEIFYP